MAGNEAKGFYRGSTGTEKPIREHKKNITIFLGFPGAEYILFFGVGTYATEFRRNVQERKCATTVQSCELALLFLFKRLFCVQRNM